MREVNLEAFQILMRGTGRDKGGNGMALGGIDEDESHEVGVTGD